jgi:uncharacterized protein (DUF1499 family)
MTFIRNISVCILFITTLSGCLVLPLKQTTADRSLYWCPPLLNCASTEAVTPIHSIDPFPLAMDFKSAWPIIKQSVSELKGTTIEVEYDGYLYAKSHSAVLKFVDYVEVLYMAKSNQLNVRSSSLLGIWDVNVNRSRTHALRKALKEKGVIN